MGQLDSSVSVALPKALSRLMATVRSQEEVLSTNYREHGTNLGEYLDRALLSIGNENG